MDRAQVQDLQRLCEGTLKDGSLNLFELFGMSHELPEEVTRQSHLTLKQ